MLWRWKTLPLVPLTFKEARLLLHHRLPDQHILTAGGVLLVSSSWYRVSLLSHLAFPLRLVHFIKQPAAWMKLEFDEQ